MSSGTPPPELASFVQQALETHAPEVFFVDAEWEEQPEPILHLLLDTDSGITLGQCTELQKLLRPELETVGLLPDTHGLAISSPGVGRPLRLERQYPQNLGRSLRLVMTDGQELAGILRGVSPTQLQLDVLLPNRKGRKPVYQSREVDRTLVKEAVVTVSFTANS